MTTQLQQEINAITGDIITHYQPEKIILFGSAVRGEITEDSDLDFFIIKKDVPYYGRDRYRELVGKIQPRVACDFLVYTPKEVKRRLFLGDPFVKQIIDEGKVLYG